jgi:hypothetical protein
LGEPPDEARRERPGLIGYFHRLTVGTIGSYKGARAVARKILILLVLNERTGDRGAVEKVVVSSFYANKALHFVNVRQHAV